MSPLPDVRLVAALTLVTASVVGCGEPERKHQVNAPCTPTPYEDRVQGVPPAPPSGPVPAEHTPRGTELTIGQTARVPLHVAGDSGPAGSAAVTVTAIEKATPAELRRACVDAPDRKAVFYVWATIELLEVTPGTSHLNLEPSLGGSSDGQVAGSPHPEVQPGLPCQDVKLPPEPRVGDVITTCNQLQVGAEQTVDTAIWWTWKTQYDKDNGAFVTWR